MLTLGEPRGKMFGFGDTYEAKWHTLDGRDEEQKEV